MLFNSLVFVAFLALVYPVWRALPLSAGRWWILAASLVFYGWWSPAFLALLLGTATLDWALALGMERASDAGRKRLVTVSVVSNLGTLAVFKYLGFFASELHGALASVGIDVPVPALRLVLPVGISFYTFQAMAYTVDVYRRQVAPCRNLAQFLLFITFFPQLVAGPIERSERLMPQLQDMRRADADQHARAAWLVIWGFFKKVVVADNLAPVVAAGFEGTAPGGATVVLAAYAFTWQIYCDFSGYSDIARGVALLFGVDLMENFRRPFFASSPREIWHRWHISLSEWLRDYLYVPLGGNRGAAGRNLILTMLLGGLWHGANWTFVLWGLWHGVALALGRALPRPNVPRVLLVAGTFHVTMLGFVLFRAHDLTHIGALASRVAQGVAWSAPDGARAGLLGLLAACVLSVELAEERLSDAYVIHRLPRAVQGIAFVTLTAAVAVLGSTYAVEFIYFQF